MVKRLLADRKAIELIRKVSDMSRAPKKKRTPATKKQDQKPANVDLKDVRQRVRNVIGARAEELAVAVTREAVHKAQAQPMKILFEMIGLFPESEAERAAAADDQSLAKTLLERLGLSDEALENEKERAPNSVVQEPVEVLMVGSSDPVK